MIYSWIPSMTLCMSILNNSTLEPSNTNRINTTNLNLLSSYMDAVMVIAEAAKQEITNRATSDNLVDDRADNTEPSVSEDPKARCPQQPMDCEELLDCGYTLSGIYHIWPRSRMNTWGEAGFDVFCDMTTDGGGWTVLQRRDDFGTNSDFFFKGWISYKYGFGNLNYDFWLGNDKILALSNQRRAQLRFDLWDFEGDDGYATYDDFYLDDENNAYRIHIGDYRGIIGDSFKGHNGMQFSTRDRDNDNNNRRNCALLYKGGWWYNNCHTVNLNGLYLKGIHDTYADGVNWYTWKGFRYSLRKTEMKLRSTSFRQKHNIVDVTPVVVQPQEAVAEEGNPS